MSDLSRSVAEEDHPRDVQKGIPVRLGCGAIFISTILCSIIVLGIVKLIGDGEIEVTRGELEGYRLWLISDENLRGLGLSSTREVDRSSTPGLKCVATKVRFLEFASSWENVDTDYCECYQSQDGDWIFISDCPD